jgi:predicted N-acetyltransferase YhbS
VVSAVRPEQAQDADAIRAVHEAAFGQPDEARLVDALRLHRDTYLGLVATDGDAVVSHIALSPATLHYYASEFSLVAPTTTQISALTASESARAASPPARAVPSRTA